MPHLTRANRSTYLAVATAMAAAGVLVAPETANATACLEYKVVGSYELTESTGYRVQFSPPAADADPAWNATGSRVTAFDGGGAVRNKGGVANAYLRGPTIYLDVEWKNGWGTEYSGDINDAGMVVNGTKRDWIRFEEHFHTWNSTVPLVCRSPGVNADWELGDPVPLPR